jgi:Ribosomal protein L7/L12 C-terminal domain
MNSPDLEQFKGILLAIACENPYISLLDALEAAGKVEQGLVEDARLQRIAAALEQVHGVLGTDPPPTDVSPPILGEWAMRQKVVMDYLPHKKINAIKELRAISGAGLKEAKEAVEWIEGRRRGVTVTLMPKPTY